MVIFAAKHGWFAAGRSGEGGDAKSGHNPLQREQIMTMKH